jgi:DNA repair protein SbcC/Rad50
MKLKFTNFLCYEEFEIDLGKKGISLLSGNSGSGKTSILKGVFFALFGDGNKVQTYGKTSCKVELYFDDMKIIRTKRPNRLVVNAMYEDDAGQEVINKKFGNTFKTSGYIQQNNLNSFMVMPPADKLEFLEKFACKDIDIAKIKIKTKASIQQANEDLINITAQLNTTKNIFEEMDAPLDIKFPLPFKNKSSILKIIKNQKIKFSNYLVLRKRIKKFIKNTEDELHNVNFLNISISSKLENLKDMRAKIDEINDDLENEKVSYFGDENLAKLKEDLSNCLRNKELIELRNQMLNNENLLLDMKENEIMDLHNELENINSTLWTEYSKEETSNLIEDLKSCLVNLEKQEKLEKELSTIDNTESAITNKKEELTRLNDLLISKKEMIRLQHKTYTCPCCSSNLKLVNDKLEISNLNHESLVNDEVCPEKLNEEILIISKEISKLTKSLLIDEANLEKAIAIKKEIFEIKKLYEDDLESDDIVVDLNYLKEFKHSQLLLEKKTKEIRHNIDNEVFSSSYNSFLTNNQNLRLKVQHLEDNSRIQSYDEEYLRREINEQENSSKKLKHLSIELKKLETKENEINNSISDLKEKHESSYKEIRSEDILSGILIEKENELSQIQDDMKKQEELLLEITNWEANEKEIVKYDNFKEKIKVLEDKEKESRAEYVAVSKFRDKILEAESLAMINIINSINQHASIYLESFFPDHPISVSLLTFKEGKDSVKPKINVNVFYKGMETDLTPLSGGELSRVILAFTLALAEMFNTPLLMLDECTSNLDQELSNIIFETISENFSGKQTIVVAHQVVEGCFDKVIKL